MGNDDSGSIAVKMAKERIKTKFPGVYFHKIINKRTGRPDTAFDICYRDEKSKFRWRLIGYASDGVNAAYANISLMVFREAKNPNRHTR